MNFKVKRSVAGVLGVLWCGYSVLLFSRTFQAYRLPLAGLWVAGAACFVLHPKVSASFTIYGLRRVKAALVSISVFLSLLTFSQFHELRDQFGKHHVEGYRSWEVESFVGDFARPWTAKTRQGRWSVGLFELLIFAGIFALPVITVKTTRRAILNKRADCVFTSDGKTVETYETNG